MQISFQLTPSPAFTGLVGGPTSIRTITASERTGLSIAFVLSRRVTSEMLAKKVADVTGIMLPLGPRRARSGKLALAGIGPGAWLATNEDGDRDFSSWLREAVAGEASVIDQSDGYGLLRLAGRGVRDTLNQLVSIDLRPEIFKVDDVAVTVAGHIGSILWRDEDESVESSAFEVAVPRSSAGSFWHLLAGSARSILVDGAPT